MSQSLTSDSPLSPTGPASMLARLLLGAGAVVLVGWLAWMLYKWVSSPSAPPRQQVARIAILPDAPPPPPPPPPKEEPPAPKSEPKPQPTPDNTPKPPAPANDTLKMEGAAGDGPSAFQAGSVTQDYRGGPTTPGAGASAPTLVDRAAERLYANSLRQSLREELERQLPSEAGELTAQFALWVSPDGRLQRWELEGAAAEQRQELNAALSRSAGQLQLPPPAGLTQPLRFRLSVRSGS